MPAPRPIIVEGLTELQRSLKAIERSAARELYDGLRDAARIVSRSAASKVPARTGRAASSIKPRATARGASIAFGGPRAPYYPWLDFGGSVGPGHRPRQSGSGAVKRPFIKEGRYVYPTIAAKSDEVLQRVDELMADLIRRHDITTTGRGDR